MTLSESEHAFHLYRGALLEREYRDYMNACLTGDDATESALETFVGTLFFPQVDRTVPSEIFEEFVFPLLTVLPRSFYPVVVALNNPDCPPDVLFAACVTGEYRYSYPAAHNINCPEEGRILFALTPKRDSRQIRL